jgi:hypothetical protein
MARAGKKTGRQRARTTVYLPDNIRKLGHRLAKEDSRSFSSLITVLVLRAERDAQQIEQERTHAAA